LANFTLLDLCVARRSRNKLSLLLSISMIAMGSYYVNSPFGLGFVGTVTYLVYFLVGYWMRNGKEGEVESGGEERMSAR
jgi:hypothetical protein